MSPPEDFKITITITLINPFAYFLLIHSMNLYYRNPEAKMLQMGQEIITYEEYSETMGEIANSPIKAIPRGVSRAEVVAAFQKSFEMIGGVPRMAVWADENPSEFYKLYAKLLPSQSSQSLDAANEKVVRHVLPRTALDE